MSRTNLYTYHSPLATGSPLEPELLVETLYIVHRVPLVTALFRGVFLYLLSEH